MGTGLTAAITPGPAPLVLAGADEVARTAAELIAKRPRPRVLVPTGRTPLGVYAALRAHAARGELPSAGAAVFQLDEYRGLGRDDGRSFGAYVAVTDRPRETTAHRIAELFGSERRRTIVDYLSWARL